ncbi:MAG: hypothetical protein KY439_09010 [Actinobacteria bacterium]|nr:hypothetical protein [Actinomycetota bacterium]
MPHRRRRVFAFAAALVALAVAACGGGSGPGGGEAGAGAGDDSGFVAQVASFELVAGPDQRFLAGLSGNGTGTVVSFGLVEMRFFYLGTRERPVDPPQARGSAQASFLPVPGARFDPAAPGPREVKPSEGVGVYAAEPVRFDTPGFWGVDVRAPIGGRTVSAKASFEVYAEPQLPFPGQPAPRTDNPVAGAAGVDPAAIDSRARGGEAIPDTALHSTSVAAALAAGRPTVVVVSTPVYCVSQFCGPVTDSVAALAERYGDQAAFVHLEVWQDFEKKIVNPAAAEWIKPKGRGDTQEPWVFLVGGDGIVRQRFDNVVSDAALEAAVKELVAAPA